MYFAWDCFRNEYLCTDVYVMTFNLILICTLSCKPINFLHFLEWPMVFGGDRGQKIAHHEFREMGCKEDSLLIICTMFKIYIINFTMYILS